MSSAKIIYWRDIPTQIVIGSGRKSTKRPLADRFMVAVDKAAMTAGATSDDAYIAEWHSVAADAPAGEPIAAAEALAEKLEQAYPASRLADLARNGGKEHQSQEQK